MMGTIFIIIIYGSCRESFLTARSKLAFVFGAQTEWSSGQDDLFRVTRG